MFLHPYEYEMMDALAADADAGTRHGAPRTRRAGVLAWLSACIRHAIPRKP